MLELQGRLWITRASRTRSSVWKVSDKPPGWLMFVYSFSHFDLFHVVFVVIYRVYFVGLYNQVTMPVIRILMNCKGNLDNAI